MNPFSAQHMHSESNFGRLHHYLGVLRAELWRRNPVWMMKNGAQVEHVFVIKIRSLGIQEYRGVAWRCSSHPSSDKVFLLIFQGRCSPSSIASSRPNLFGRTRTVEPVREGHVELVARAWKLEACLAYRITWQFSREKPIGDLIILHYFKPP